MRVLYFKVILKTCLLVRGVIVTVCKFQWTTYKQNYMVTDYSICA